MAKGKTLSIENINEKRDALGNIVKDIANDINNLQELLHDRQQSLQLNQGALLQLNLLLEELNDTDQINDGETVVGGTITDVASK